MRVLAVIPARYSSTRLPGKPLVDIGGKPMIRHVYERTSSAKLVDECVVATDDRRIAEACEGFGAKVAVTSPDHPSGTDRVAEVARRHDAEIVVNVQGDEPLIDPRAIDQAVSLLLDDETAFMGTLVHPITSREELVDPGVAKVVCDNSGYALYFSRAPIPFPFGADIESLTDFSPFYKHVSIYVFRKQFLLQFTQMEPTPLERFERLEQLRALENGVKIRVAVTQYNSVGVDTPADLDRVRALLHHQQT